MNRQRIVGVALAASAVAAWIVGGWVLGLLHEGRIPMLDGVVLQHRTDHALSFYLDRVRPHRTLLSGSMALIGGLLLVSEERLSRVVGWIDRYALQVFGGALTSLLAFAYLPPSRAVFPGHDFLDSNLTLLALRGRDPQFFDLNARLDGFLGGVPLSTLTIHDLDPFANLYVLLEPATAAALGEILVRLLGFIGMWLLMSHHVLPAAPVRRTPAAAAAFLFALLPFWPSVAPTIALQPLFLHGVLTLRDRPRSAGAWCAVVAFPLAASLVGGGFAVLALVAGLAIREQVVDGAQAAARVLRPLIVASVLFVLFSVRPLHLVFATDFVSHRDDWPALPRLMFNEGSLERFVEEADRLLRAGQYHFASGQWGIPLLVVVVGLIIVLAVSTTRSAQGPARQTRVRLLSVLGLIVLVTTLAASEMSGVTAFGSRLPVPIQLGRVYALLPLLWVAALGLGFGAIQLLRRRPAELVTCVLALGIVAQGVIANPAVTGRLAGIADVDGITSPRYARHTVDDYYRTAAFRELVAGADLRPADMTVVSYGIDPMIAAFHGFRTLDGYHYNYPLDHKQAFRTVIADELDRAGRTSYFDDWGSRVYLTFDPDYDDVRVDFCAAHRLGAGFVIAGDDIAGPHPLQMVAQAPGLVLYRILPSSCPEWSAPELSGP